MRGRWGWLCAVALAIVALDAQNAPNPPVSDQPESIRQDIEAREKAGNGITVGSAKVYEDSVLQQMLNAAQTRLAGLLVLDQTTIGTHVGATTGATQQFSSFALNVQGPPLTGAATVPTATAAAPTTTLPTTAVTSASDVLNEQMQLTYEIANLRLLLEGSLSDRLVRIDGPERVNGDMTVMKARATLGFPIAISPDKRFKNAVAVVEVVVETNPDADLSKAGERPAITALLPREKTYNVAAITERSLSIGAGAVTQVMGVAGSFLTGKKTYYIVKDQDTVALTLAPKDPVRQSGFLWQFRPVLGKEFVQAGMKQTFVQLSFPSPATKIAGSVSVRTYWRKYDAKRGILKEVIVGSARDLKPEMIPSYDLKQDVTLFNSAQLEDLGGGQMLVKVPGTLLNGTYVRVGNTLMQAGSTGFTSEYRLIRFVAPIADLATRRTVLVSRDGTEVPLLIHDNSIDPSNPPKIKQLTLTPVDDANSLLQVQMTSPPVNQPCPLVLVIGGRVFGYSDAPIQRTRDTLAVVLPTSFLQANPTVTVRPLMVDHRYTDSATLETPAAGLTLLSQDADLVRYLLLGRQLKDVRVVSPAGLTLGTVGLGTDNTLRLLEIHGDLAKTLKQIVLQHAKDRPYPVSLPPLAAAGDAPKQEPKFQERVTVGADEAVIVGDNLSSIDKVMFGKLELTIEKSSKTIKVKGLVVAGVTAAAKTQDIVLVAKSGNTTIKLEVVSGKVETIAK